MKNLSFPANYFMSIFTPKAMFKGRKNLNWFGILFVFIFLNALLLIPIPLFYAHQTQVNLHPFMPHVEQMINNKKLQKQVNLTSYSTKNRKFEIKNPVTICENKDSILGMGLTKKQVNQKKYAVNLAANQFEFRENNLSFLSKYQSALKPKDSVVDFLQNSWFLENKGYIAGMMLITIGTIILSMNLIVSLGTAFFLYLGHKSKLSNIKTFKEACNLTLNTMGLGCIVSMIYNIFTFDIMKLMFIPMIFMVFMILLVYVRTRFLDHGVDRDQLM